MSQIIKGFYKDGNPLPLVAAVQSELGFTVERLCGSGAYYTVNFCCDRQESVSLAKILFEMIK